MSEGEDVLRAANEIGGECTKPVTLRGWARRGLAECHTAISTCSTPPNKRLTGSID
jgi:hypothetical protein